MIDPWMRVGEVGIEEGGIWGEDGLGERKGEGVLERERV